MTGSQRWQGLPPRAITSLNTEPGRGQAGIEVRALAFAPETTPTQSQSTNHHRPALGRGCAFQGHLGSRCLRQEWGLSADSLPSTAHRAVSAQSALPGVPTPFRTLQEENGETYRGRQSEKWQWNTPLLPSLHLALATEAIKWWKCLDRPTEFM